MYSFAVNANFTEQIIHSGFPTQFPIMTLQRVGCDIMQSNVLLRLASFLKRFTATWTTVLHNSMKETGGTATGLQLLFLSILQSLSSPRGKL